MVTGTLNGGTSLQPTAGGSYFDYAGEQPGGNRYSTDTKKHSQACVSSHEVHRLYTINHKWLATRLAYL